MILRSLAAVAMVFAFAMPAHAGWGGAEWGMTGDQAAAATGAKPKKDKNQDTIFYKMGHIGSWEWRGQPFEAIYSYDAQGLAAVRLQWKKKPKPEQCAGFLEWAKAEYGPPLFQNQKPVVMDVVWHDEDKQNRLWLSYAPGAGFCNLSFERLSLKKDADLKLISGAG
jgi:hypothetical protein